MRGAHSLGYSRSARHVAVDLLLRLDHCALDRGLEDLVFPLGCVPLTSKLRLKLSQLAAESCHS